MEKLWYGETFSKERQVSLRTLLVMKLILSFVFLGTLSMFAGQSYSQTQRVSLHCIDAKLSDVLQNIETQTAYLFFYKSNEVESEKVITIDVKDEKVSKVLDKVLGDTDLEYSLLKNNIVISQKSRSADISTDTENRTIKGIIKDQKGEPLPGVTVVIKGTTIGASTDLNGGFSFKVSDDNTILAISCIGFVSEEVKIGNQTNILVVLKEDVKLLDELVVIGYGTQKKSEVASSIGTVKSDDFVQGIASPDAAQLIKGKIAGLSIISPDANPNATSQISLRGITTLKASQSPLVLIDGIPGSLTTVSPQDIAQIDVLKDGSAAAIYGTRGTNGVILITTKNAIGEMPTVVEVNSYLAVQKMNKRLPFMNADEYRELVQQGKVGAQDYGASTNWLDEVTRSPLAQVYSISLRGGSSTTNYVASLEYRSQEGVIKRTNNQIIYPRIEINHRMFNEKLKITMGLSGQKQTDFSGSDGGSYDNAVYKNAIMYNPTDPIRNEEGGWTEHNKTDYYNPVALLKEVDGKNQATDIRAFGVLNFTPIKGLNIKYLVSMDIYNQTRGYYRTKDHILNVKSVRTGFASRGTTRTEEDLSELTAQYNKTILADHHFSLLGGYSWMRNNMQNYWMQNFNFPSDDFSYNNMGSGQALKDGLTNMSSLKEEHRLIGYFGRFTYGYQSKYNLSVTVRHEGSTKFGANNKWGTFPAFSAAWNITEENFMKEFQIMNSLKLRAGYGITGTAPTDPYTSLTTIDFNDYVNMGNKWSQSLKPSNNPYPDLKWEKKKEFNIGVDFAFFDDRLSGSVDYYNRKTVDLLWDYKVATPPYIHSTMMANAGSMKNTGIEVSLSGTPLKVGDWQWNTSMNYSTNKNKLISLSNDKFVSIGYADRGGTGEPIQLSTHRIQEGQPIGNFYGYKSIDIDDNGRWIVEGSDGKPKSIEDIQPEDKHIIGNGLPKHYLNWNNTITYKKFDLGITMRGAFGFDILNMAKMHYSVPSMLTRGNIFKSSYDNIYGKRPLSETEGPQYLSYYIEKGDYWKIDNVTLGYTLNMNNPYIKLLRVYGSISNLATITGYSGIDPEVSVSGLTPGGDDRNRYPSARTFTLGVNLKF